MLLKFLLNKMGKVKAIAKEHGGLIFKVRLLQELFVCFLTVIYDANASTLVLGGLSSILEQIQLKIFKRVNRGQICNSEGVRFCIGVSFLFCTTARFRTPASLRKKKHYFMFILHVFYNRQRWQRKWPGQMWPPGGPDVWETQYHGPCDGGLPHQREAAKPHLFSLKTISVNTASIYSLLLRGLVGTSHTSKLRHLVPEFWNVLNVMCMDVKYKSNESVKQISLCRNGIQVDGWEDQDWILFPQKSLTFYQISIMFSCIVQVRVSQGYM